MFLLEKIIFKWTTAVMALTPMSLSYSANNLQLTFKPCQCSEIFSNDSS